MSAWLAMFCLAAGPSVDASLTNPSGGVVRLSEFRGRPVLLIFEDRDSTTVNQALKDRLFAAAAALGLLDRVGLVAVAYLAPFDFFPAKQFALSHVRELSKRLGIDIFVDFDGAMTKAPLRLPARGSSVLLLDADGRVVYRRTGSHTSAEVEALVALVAAEAHRS